MDELVRFRKERDEITEPIGYFAICVEAHLYMYCRANWSGHSFLRRS